MPRTVPPPNAAQRRATLDFRVLGRLVRVVCHDPKVRALVVSSYGAFATSAARGAPSADLDLEITREAGASGFRVARQGRVGHAAADLGLLLYRLDREITVESQKLRPDLYFIHAAALERQGRISLIVADSGVGKSTLAWALLHHGFRFSSDELAPIELEDCRVHGYPRALALKADPPDAFPLPAAAVRTSRTVHVPVRHLPALTTMAPLPLRAIFFLRRDRGMPPAVRPLSAGEAAARLYVNTLNALAHAAQGLDAAVRITARVPSFLLQSGDLAATSRLVRATLAGG